MELVLKDQPLLKMEEVVEVAVLEVLQVLAGVQQAEMVDRAQELVEPVGLQ
ncbi:hypothetical protein P872_00230 [Rhodonellum psychrophilum GCM71 = DSM 17998]|uniref:Uncharacterized protein n=1 Tax=Rhodonellum psychrophilum GCM71 = DSM 17998 TaxID=1123057 RepID=U5C3P0_9BACT|nr:hypothetical protein P872_00230 [Rhodonellum psychrophilum GCM71 = DSM 17998]